jgi:hypothetical protein
MTNLRQVAQQALEALEDERYVTKYTHIVEAITALKAALAQPEQQAEPCIGKDPRCPCQDGDACHYKDCGNTKARPVAQPEQEPVAYDKTELNRFVQDLYDEKMQNGKHGHYETLFHVVHQAIKKVAPPAAQRPWQGLTDEEMSDAVADMEVDFGDLLWKVVCLTKLIEAKLKERNGY